ncbi:MAG: hypothetical protein ACR2HR_08625 [Euzebya sp.]
MSGSAQAEALLAEARQLLDRGDSELGSVATRAAALLGRSALEEAIWSLFPSLKEVNSRAMLLTFTAVMSTTTGPRAAMAGGRLTTASHHHVYEMPLTPAELTPLLDVVHDMIGAIRARQARAVELRRPSTS